MNTVTTNEHIHIARIQNNVASHLGIPPEQLVFDYRTDASETVLNLITINPVHEQSFLFKSVTGSSKVDALEKLMEYVEHHKDKESSFTIQWSSRGEHRLETSYFRGGNIYDVLNKFHFGRDMNATIIYSIVLNPIS